MMRTKYEHLLVSTHSRLKAAGAVECAQSFVNAVSTHSRLKAAGQKVFMMQSSIGCFNTQPPEGGWLPPTSSKRLISSFNTQPPEGGWMVAGTESGFDYQFQHTAA